MPPNGKLCEWLLLVDATLTGLVEIIVVDGVDETGSDVEVSIIASASGEDD